MSYGIFAYSSMDSQFNKEKYTTLRSLISRETLINGEGGIIVPAGRLEKIFYYIKNRVQGGILF